MRWVATRARYRTKGFVMVKPVDEGSDGMDGLHGLESRDKRCYIDGMRGGDGVRSCSRAVIDAKHIDPLPLSTYGWRLLMTSIEYLDAYCYLT